MFYHSQKALAYYAKCVNYNIYGKIHPIEYAPALITKSRLVEMFYGECVTSHHTNCRQAHS
jgi:hypothetical protein